MLVIGVAIGSVAFPTTKTYTEAQVSTIYSNVSWQVLKTNVTVSYDAECLVLEPTGHTCPTISAGANGTSGSPMRNVELNFISRNSLLRGKFQRRFRRPFRLS